MCENKLNILRVNGVEVRIPFGTAQGEVKIALKIKKVQRLSVYT